ncbi:MAG: hypothetical protein IIB19_06760 [Chloroflexi bacterium]|nr:hypothetical protein [Chloroflexota bacterium]
MFALPQFNDRVDHLRAYRRQVTSDENERIGARHGGWLAQELLTTFEEDLSEVAIKPSSGGIFEVALDGDVIATNRETKVMPDAGEVKRLLRDRIAPARTIGHE